MNKIFSRAGAISCALSLGLALSSAPVFGQTATAPALTAFSIERVVQLTSVGATGTPNVPANILAGIASGALEIRERLIYNSQAATVTSTLFLVPAGSPNPTPLQTDVTGTTLATIVSSVDKIYIGSKPNPSVLFAGSVAQGVTPYGSLTGAPYTLSIGYTTDTPAKINNVTETAAGVINIYSSGAAGTVTVTQPTTPGGGGSTTDNPTIVLGQTSITTAQKLIRLDASQSTDPNGLALTYLWTSTGPSATILNPTSATPDVQINQGFNTYTFTVTVTNSKNLSSTATVTVNYIGR